jgi:hypothetical protein
MSGIGEKRKRPVRRQVLKFIDPDDENTDVVPTGALGGILTAKQTALAKLVFDPSVLDAWIRSGSGRRSSGEQRLLKVRDIWELSKPKTQCVNTIGGVNTNTTCWICGFGIPVRPTKDQFGLAAECEHILPIAQAVMLWGLYSTQAAGPDRKTFLMREYGWAHECCNHIKSDLVLIRPSEASENVFEMNNYKAASLLDSIFNTNRKDGQALKKLIQARHGRKVQEFVNDRLGAMSQKMAPMLETLNKQLENAGPGIMLLTSAIKSKENVNKSIAEIQSAQDIADKISMGVDVVTISFDEYERLADEGITVNEDDLAAQAMADMSTGNKYVKLAEESESEGAETAPEGQQPDKSGMLLTPAGQTQAQPTPGSPGSTQSVGSPGSGSQSSKGSVPGGRRKRRTRRRTDRVFPKRHHSIKMSSIRHSLSGKAASR